MGVNRRRSSIGEHGDGVWRTAFEAAEFEGGLYLRLRGYWRGNHCQGDCAEKWGECVGFLHELTAPVMGACCR